MHATGETYFMLKIHPDWLWAPPSLSNKWVAGTLSQREKQMGHEGEVKNAWSYTSSPPCTFMAWCLSTGYIFTVWYLVKHKDNFTFTLYFIEKSLQVQTVLNTMEFDQILFLVLAAETRVFNVP